MQNTLTSKQAFDAMYRFLELYYNATQSGELAVLLSGLSLLSDGITADPACSCYWDETVQAILKENNALPDQTGDNKERTFSFYEAYKAVIKFLEDYYLHQPPPDIATFISRMKLLPDGGVIDPSIWTNWLKAIDLMLNEKDPTYGDLKLKNTITIQEAFDGMACLIAHYYEQTKSADLKSLLKILLLVGGQATDPRAAQIWGEAIQAIKEDVTLRRHMAQVTENTVTFYQAYLVVIKFLEDYCKGAELSDVQALINRMRIRNGKALDPSIWNDWLDITTADFLKKNQEKWAS
jgi:hypothetical protein